MNIHTNLINDKFGSKFPKSQNYLRLIASAEEAIIPVAGCRWFTAVSWDCHRRWWYPTGMLRNRRDAAFCGGGVCEWGWCDPLKRKEPSEPYSDGFFCVLNENCRRLPTTIATDTAQIVLMDGSLKQLVQSFDLAKNYNDNLNQSFLITLIPTMMSVG